MTNKDNPNYYAIIPANVRYDKAIPAGAKLLYGEVTALSNQKGYCFASNGYFAMLYGCTPQAISKWFKQLEQAGHVSISYHENDGQQQRRVSIAVDRYQPQLRRVSTRVEGVSTTVEHNNTRLLIQEDNRENAPAKNETHQPKQQTLTPSPNSAPPPSPEFFSPDKHEKAAAEVIRYLEENPMYLNGMAKDWKRAVKGHCLGLQKKGKWNDLTIPQGEGQYWSWIGARVAGAKSWYQVATEIDKKSGRTPDAITIKAVPKPKQAGTPTRRASAAQARKIAGL